MLEPGCTYVRARAQRIRRRPDPQRHDLRRVQPRHSQPADGEEGVEDEQEQRGDDAGRFAADLGHNGEDGHGEGLPGGAEQHQRAAAELLDREDGDPGREEVLGAVGSGEDAGHGRGEVDFVLVDGGGVVGDEVDAADLLEDLVDVREHRAVEVAVRRAGEEVAVATLAHLEDRVLDFEEFVVDEGVVRGQIAQR